MANNSEEELKKVENSVRDFITFVLSNEFGSDWISHLKISSERVAKWKERQEIESKRLNDTILENRLIYYADFYDLKSIINKHWNEAFKAAFKDQKWIDINLSELERFRDPHAHRRELFEYQKSLIQGISGEIRSRIMKYRGKKEDVQDYFPVIESVVDSLGNSASNTKYAQTIVSDVVCRVGDTVEIQVFSTDPQGGELEYSIQRLPSKKWSDSNKNAITFTSGDIGKMCDINVMIRSKRGYYAYSDFDDYVMYRYTVLPS